MKWILGGRRWLQVATAVGLVASVAGSVVLATPVHAAPKLKLNTISITPANPSLLVGGFVLQLTAVGTYRDGSSADLTQTLSWTSSDSTIATVGANTGLLISGAVPGSATITAETTMGRKIRGSTVVAVSSGTLTRISIVPVLPYDDPVYVASGDTAGLTAIGVDTNGVTWDVTADVTWSSNNTSIATVDAIGRVTAAQPGTATITARKGSFLSDLIPVNVGPAELRAMDVRPTSVSVSISASVQFQAVGQFSDGSTMDLTCDPATTWSSSAPSIADFVSTCGLATAETDGTAMITATTTADIIDPAGFQTQVDVSGSASLTVLP